MKIKDFSHIIRSEFFLSCCFSALNYKDILTGNISPEESKILLGLNMLYPITAILENNFIKNASDYKEMYSLYNEVINRTTKLFKDLDINNPVEVFSAYVFMYRNGFLSHQNNFKYSIDLKDLPGLYGIDIIRGKGVCRTISSFLVNLYDNMGFDSSNIAVNATEESIKKQQRLNDTILEKDDKIKPEMMNALLKITNFLHIANHMVTYVKDKNGHNYYFDPTNDGLLTLNEKQNNLTLYEEKMKIMHIQNILGSLLGVEKYKLNKCSSDMQISEEEYKELYLHALELCKHNLEYFKEFAYNNEALYDNIFNLSEEQHNLFGRMFPFIPKKTKEIILNNEEIQKLNFLIKK